MTEFDGAVCGGGCGGGGDSGLVRGGRVLGAPYLSCDEGGHSPDSRL